MTERDVVRIGVSSCLLGNEVRHDGRHKHARLLTDVVAAYVELVPICPEVELGLGVPREPIQLVGRGALRLLGVDSRSDHTDAMRAWSAGRVRELEALDLGGYVFKAGSPSCGVRGVARHDGAQVEHDGVGMWARAFQQALPLVPVEEEGRLADARLLGSFVARVLDHERDKARARGTAGAGLADLERLLVALRDGP